MALQPSGNRQVELVSIETEKIYFTIKGRFKSTGFDYPEEVCRDSFSYRCFPEEDIIDINLYSDKILFFEYTDYQIIIESKADYELRFYHENVLIRNQIACTTKSKRVMAGNINFRGDIGLTELVVYLNNREYLIVRLEIFPSKLDYKTDYLDILLDVNEEIHNLAFEFLRRTYFSMALMSEEGSSLTEFYSILSYIFNRLIESINIIIQQPHHDLVKHEGIVPYHKIKNAGKDTIRWLEKNPTQLIRKNNRLVPLKALEVRKISTVDTYENCQDGKNKRDIFGAFVLFPYSNEEEYKKHRFYRSIESVNVGGIPFLPNSTELLEEFLDELIEESSPSSYERSLRQRGHNYYLKSSYFDERTVLLGSLSSREQLCINLKNKFYHTKLSNVDLKKHLIKTVAIGQSKRFFGSEAGVRYYGRVKDIRIVKRKEIREIPRDSDELYIRFEIEEWKQLDNPIKAEGFQVITVLYTTDYLLKNAKTVSELCIRDEEEFRLWMELKRLDSEVEAMSEDEIHKKSSIKGFSIGNKDIYITEDKIRIIKDGKVQEHLRSDFRKNPKLIVRLIKRA